MKKIGTKLLVVLAVALGGVAASQEPTMAKSSNTISSIPSGHFQSSKAHYAFRWQSVQSGKKKAQVLVLGDFNKPSVQLGYPTKYKLSKNRRTLTTYYRLSSSKGKLGKTTYRMDVYKYSSSKYRVKLNQYKAGLLPSYKGSAYTFNVTKKSPAQNYATTYTKPKLFNAAYKPTYDANYEPNYKAAYNAYLNDVTDAINKQAQQDYKDGKNGDPSTSEAQQDIKNEALKYVNDNVDKITQNVTTNLTKSVTQEVNKDVDKTLQNLVSAYNNLK